MKILAVDDEAIMLQQLCESIEKAAPEAELVSYQKPSFALEYVTKNKIDVAFLDIQMRGMDGIELGKKIKQLQPKVNVIFCTGFSDYLYEAINKVAL